LLLLMIYNALKSELEMKQKFTMRFDDIH